MAIAFRNTTVRPYADTTQGKVMAERVSRGIESSLDIVKLTDDTTHSAIAHITGFRV